MKELPHELVKAIDERAEKIKDFFLDFQRLGTFEARKRLVAWCQNFTPFLDDLKILTPVIKNINFISDQEIVSRSMQEAKACYPPPESNLFICPFGGDNESSARMTGILNDHPGLFRSLEDCLKFIAGSNIAKPVIIFIDDFLNSGGQFASIISSWFSSAHEKGVRKCLPDNMQNTLRHCRLHFYFYLGMQSGRQVADETLKRFCLNGRITVFQQYDDTRGIFGNPNSLGEIRLGLDKPVSDTSVFKDFTCKEVRPFLDLCETVGRSFLSKHKPEWPPEKLAGRILGYGNSAQLFLSSNNVPTSTLTCLWAGGPVEINGQTVEWQEFLPRREKKTGSESEKIKFSQTLHTHACPYLDCMPGKDSAFELMLFSHLHGLSADDIKFYEVEDRTGMAMRVFMPETRDKLSSQTNPPSSVAFYKFSQEQLAQFNDRPNLIIANCSIPLKKLKASLVKLGNSLFGGLQFQFPVLDISYDNCLDRINKMSQTRASGKDAVILKTARGAFQLIEIFDSIFNTRRPISSDYERFNILAFMRLSASTLSPDASLESCLAPLKTFKPLKGKKIPPDNIELNDGTLLTVSEEGAAAICLSDSPAANSYIQKIMMTQCFFLYLAGYAEKFRSLQAAEDNFCKDSDPLVILKDARCVKNFFDDFKSLAIKTFSRKGS